MIDKDYFKEYSTEDIYIFKGAVLSSITRLSSELNSKNDNIFQTVMNTLNREDLTTRTRILHILNDVLVDRKQLGEEGILDMPVEEKDKYANWATRSPDQEDTIKLY